VRVLLLVYVCVNDGDIVVNECVLVCVVVNVVVAVVAVVNVFVLSSCVRF
jgi:hypothetical protein